MAENYKSGLNEIMNSFNEDINTIKSKKYYKLKIILFILFFFINSKANKLNILKSEEKL